MLIAWQHDASEAYMHIQNKDFVKNTLVYTQLVAVGDDEFISKTATNAEEARQLIEIGFEYVCTTPGEKMLFRKRK